MGVGAIDPSCAARHGRARPAREPFASRACRRVGERKAAVGGAGHASRLRAGPCGGDGTAGPGWRVGGPAVGPVHDVVPVAPARRTVTARNATAVADRERSALRGRHGAAGAPDVGGSLAPVVTTRTTLASRRAPSRLRRHRLTGHVGAARTRPCRGRQPDRTRSWAGRGAPTPRHQLGQRRPCVARGAHRPPDARSARHSRSYSASSGLDDRPSSLVQTVECGGPANVSTRAADHRHPSRPPSGSARNNNAGASVRSDAPSTPGVLDQQPSSRASTSSVLSRDAPPTPTAPPSRAQLPLSLAARVNGIDRNLRRAHQHRRRRPAQTALMRQPRGRRHRAIVSPHLPGVPHRHRPRHRRLSAHRTASAHAHAVSSTSPSDPGSTSHSTATSTRPHGHDRSSSTQGKYSDHKEGV